MTDSELISELDSRGFSIADGSLCTTHDRISSGRSLVRCSRFDEIVEANLARADRRPIYEPLCVFRRVRVVLAAVDDVGSVVRLGIANL